MEHTNKANFELITVLIPDEKTGYFSAFFAQFPEVIAQGGTENEAQNNLFTIFTIMLKDKLEMVTKELDKHTHYTTKPLNLVTA